MANFKNIFQDLSAKDEHTGPKSSPDPNSGETIKLALLNELIPIRNIEDDILAAFALNNHAETHPADSTLFSEGESDETTLYLMSGIITLSEQSGSSFEIEANTAKAKFPLSTGVKHTMTATAKTEVSVLRVSQKIMLSRPPVAPPSFSFPAELSESRLIQIFTQHYLDDELKVPSLPDIAFKLRKAMESEIGVAEAVKIIQLDPAISAKLIKIANCPLYVTAFPATTIHAAASRLGLNAAKNLVTSFSLKQLFTCNTPHIKELFKKTWKHSIYISGICHVLASTTNKIDPEEALLAGLLSEIGVIPFLDFAAGLPANYFSEQEITKAIPFIRGPLGSYILEKWDFPKELVKIPLLADDWYHFDTEEITIADIVILARIHASIRSPNMSELPAISSIPAASKLEDHALTPEHSLKIITEAKDKINEALNIFRT